jgi:hypothetical protein
MVGCRFVPEIDSSFFSAEKNIEKIDRYRNNIEEDGKTL